MTAYLPIEKHVKQFVHPPHVATKRLSERHDSAPRRGDRETQRVDRKGSPGSMTPARAAQNAQFVARAPPDIATASAQGAPSFGVQDIRRRMTSAVTGRPKA